MMYALPEEFSLPDRQWPSRRLTQAPRWCAVDLRDGNQALPVPMSPVQKFQYFARLVSIGFREIEIGFPAASQDDWNFCRALIERKEIPEDVTISVLSQAREEILARTMEALQGVRNAIFHLYIPTSELHGKFVLGTTAEERRAQVLKSVAQIRSLADDMPESKICLEFSTEEFTDSNLDEVVSLCDAVVRQWNPAPGEKVIVNLPCTVERALPSRYADMIEAFCRRAEERARMVVSLHAHNDMGCAVAATELALLAGGERVEGTLLGNGERSGNVDLMILALNLQAMNLSTGLDFSGLPRLVSEISELTSLPVSPRYPYAGSLVFTAFSGSHQDAIGKGLRRKEELQSYFQGWKMPYLHINPLEIGRSFETSIRINSQSGRGGLSHVLESHYGVRLPDGMLAELAERVQIRADESARELLPDEIWSLFLEEYDRQTAPIRLLNYWPRPNRHDPSLIEAEVHLSMGGERYELQASDSGPVAAFAAAVRQLSLPEFRLLNYEERSIGSTVQAEAITIVTLESASGQIYFAAGFGANIVQGAARAIISGLNRMLANRENG